MAEPIVNNVLEKLDHMIVNDAQVLGVVHKQVKWVQSELTRLQCSQVDADYKRRQGDTRAEHWLKRLREVAYHIEDATDTFYKELGVGSQKDPSFLRKLKKLCHMPMAEPMPILHKLATELADIQNVLEGISKTKGHYAPHKGSGEAARRVSVDLDVDETEEPSSDERKICMLLLTKEIPRRAVLPIVGPGGTGKTILAHQVYKSVTADFDYHIWITVSQHYNLIDLLCKMLSQLNYSGPKHQDLDYLGRELFGLLSSRRYLIVLDDVWSHSLWDELRNVLPDNNNRSRVLMTSRQFDIARLADVSMDPYKLAFHSEDESLDLLLKNALPLQKPDEVYPSDLLNVAKQLSNECWGIPFLLVHLGKILSMKDPTYIAWERVWGSIHGKKWVELWDQLERALPDDTLPDNIDEGHVLMTVEHIATAKSTDPSIAPNEHFLDEAQGRELLLKKAVPYQKCPRELLELADDISKKCMGLRLALIVVGCILRRKDKTKNAWEEVLKQMNCKSHLYGMNILNMSYEDMPYYLKASFLYLSSFPEDYEIPAKRLIRMWVAEGFIPKQAKKTMEETAEDCLEQLFKRCMVRVTGRSPNGSIKYCQVMHYILFDFALHQAKMENFLAVITREEDINNSDTVTRRASIQSCSSQCTEYVGLSIRSLLWFGRRNDLPNYSKYILLRVLEIEGVKMSHVIELRGLEQLIHLKYLGFRNCEQLTISTCPFGRLKNLETLDLRGILMPYGASTDLWTIGTLRHVLYEPFERYNLELPTWVDLKNLQTVKWVSDSDTETHTKQFPTLNNMRKLGLTNCKNWDLVSCRLGAMPSLISLGIKGGNIPEKIVYPTSLPNYMNLQTLCLVGKWSEGIILEASLLPPNLVKLKLVNSELAQDPMPELGKLNSLKKLVLSGDVYTGEQLFCPAGFPVLQTLELFISGLEELTVKNGVMPKLKDLRRPLSLKLELPPDLKPSVRDA
ncbi:hypothetical protein LUZ63_012220 [Rhynchospora breviuscula]|uniref:Uncharacterized protein n=1 Tax=Rhynchospora breviuscula TaxID=2022672 RepID=A0A9Q0CK91_9POAL|nr:hypothetical protein LUZ63_012220 [Rhynchospora breviuscula]